MTPADRAPERLPLSRGVEATLAHLASLTVAALSPAVAREALGALVATLTRDGHWLVWGPVAAMAAGHREPLPRLAALARLVAEIHGADYPRAVEPLERYAQIVDRAGMLAAMEARVDGRPHRTGCLCVCVHLWDDCGCRPCPGYGEAKPKRRGPSCGDYRGPWRAWQGTPPPGWSPGMTSPCLACGAGCGEPHREPDDARRDALRGAGCDR